jgi:hypothetical protein
MGPERLRGSFTRSRDGSSEVLFWFSGYNQDGYVLFGDDLRKVAETYWTYH